MWRNGVVVPAYWWDGHPNFGDDLTPWLLPDFGVAPVHRVAGRARLAGVGSILEFFPADWDGAIWGSGLMYGRPHPLPPHRVHRRHRVVDARDLARVVLQRHDREERDQSHAEQDRRAGEAARHRGRGLGLLQHDGAARFKSSYELMNQQQRH